MLGDMARLLTVLIAHSAASTARSDSLAGNVHLNKAVSTVCRGRGEGSINVGHWAVDQPVTGSGGRQLSGLPGAYRRLSPEQEHVLDGR